MTNNLPGLKSRWSRSLFPQSLLTGAIFILLLQASDESRAQTCCGPFETIWQKASASLMRCGTAGHLAEATSYATYYLVNSNHISVQVDRAQVGLAYSTNIYFEYYSGGTNNTECNLSQCGSTATTYSSVAVPGNSSMPFSSGGCMATLQGPCFTDNYNSDVQFCGGGQCGELFDLMESVPSFEVYSNYDTSVTQQDDAYIYTNVQEYWANGSLLERITTHHEEIYQYPNPLSTFAAMALEEARKNWQDFAINDVPAGSLTFSNDRKCAKRGVKTV